MELVWNETGERYFETGVDRGVLYVDGLDGVAWHGLTGVTENPSGGVARPFYIDGVKYLNLADTEEFAGTISAFYSPEEFDLCDGALASVRGVLAHQQVRVPFGFSFRTKLGNDVGGADHAYKIRLIYNALATPTTRGYRSRSADVDVEPLSWAFTTRPIPFPGLQPSAHITIDSSKASALGLARLERVLYGSELEDARLPLPAELLDLFTIPPVTVTDHGDGTFTISGDDLLVTDNGDGTFTANYDGAVAIDADTFTLTST